MVDLSMIEDSTDSTMNMVRILARQRSGLTVAHINAQSLNNKIDEFRYVFQNSGIDIVCVSETWLSSFTPDSLIALQGYKVFREDREGHAGGVAVFVRHNIACRVCARSSANVSVNDKIVEFMFVEINHTSGKMLLGCVYRPHRRVPFSNFFSTLETLSAEYDNVVIAGDFNSDILVESFFTTSMSAFGLIPTNTIIPTHHTSTSRTLLDIFFVENMHKVLLYDQLSASCFSKHDLIFLAYDLNIPPRQRTVSFRDFRNLSADILAAYVNNLDWDQIFYMPSVDEQVLLLQNNIQLLYDDLVPIRSKLISNGTKPWFSSHIRQLIHRRDVAYSRWKRFRTPELRTEFRIARRNVNITIKLAKRNYYSSRFSSAIGSKQTWKHIREIGIGGTISPSDCDSGADELNEAFTNIPFTPADISFYNFPGAGSPDRTDGSSTFQFMRISQSEVSLCFNLMKSNAVGCDNMHPKFLRILLPILLPYITHLFNTIIMTGTFPSSWKYAKIIPIPKSGAGYRPIAILPYLSKVLEKILYFQMSSFITRNGLLCDMQSGFRSNHSCVSALLDVTENLRCGLDSDKVNFLVLLDHSKAFDTVDHYMLLNKLKYFFNFSPTSVKLLSSYLTDRWQSVYTKNDQSSPLKLFRGVPQGSILGPLLFSIYINDLPEQLSYCRIHMYADDIQLYLGSPVQFVGENIRRLNDELHKIHRWATANGLLINPTKSKCIVVRRRTIGHEVYDDILLNGERINVVDTARNLGIIFNGALTWSDHINSLVGRSYMKLRSLWSTQFFTPLHVREIIAKSYLIPGLLYGCELFTCCDSVSAHRLKVLYNNILRYVYGLGRLDHISNFSSRLYGVTFENLLKIRVLLLMHRIIYSQSPRYLYDRIRFARSLRGKRIIIPRYRYLVSERQFFVYAARLWNLLPHTQQLNSNATNFKKFLFDFFD